MVSLCNKGQMQEAIDKLIKGLTQNRIGHMCMAKQTEAYKCAIEMHYKLSIMWQQQNILQTQSGIKISNLCHFHPGTGSKKARFSDDLGSGILMHSSL